jgi:transposase
MSFDELSDDEWALLAAFVSGQPAGCQRGPGRPRANPRIVANAILWLLTTGEPWSRLPSRYPSVPTCRHWFEEWQLNGALAEMVRLLSEAGRTIVCIPDSLAQDVRPVSGVQTPVAHDRAQGGVVWKSPESWQAGPRAPNGGHAVEPLADISRQLTGWGNDGPLPDDPHADPQGHPRMHPVRETGMSSRQGGGACGPLLMNSSPRPLQVTDRHGYIIYAMAEAVPNAMYRAWTEIVKDGKRVERSGLVGPRFADSQDAQQYALEWACQWIDRQVRTLAAPPGKPLRTATGTGLPVSRPMRMPCPVPEPVAVSSHRVSRQRSGENGACYGTVSESGECHTTGTEQSFAAQKTAGQK